MSQTHAHAAIVIDQVSKTLGGKKRIQELSLQAESGKIYGLIGPNGSGKTTLLNLMTGLYKPDEGTVRLNGLDPVRDCQKTRRLIGLLPQSTALYPELSARENLQFHAALYLSSQKKAKARVAEILALVDLTQRADEPVKNFSGGMKRRLGIGRALLNDPQILLLDEPTLGVDVQSTHKIYEYVRRMKNDRKTVIVTTNIMAEADALCDEIIIIDQGQKICQGEPQSLKASLGSGTIHLVPKAPDGLTKQCLAEKLADFSYTNGEIIIPAPQGEKDLAAVLDQLKDTVAFERIALYQPSLDDVFLAYTGKNLRD